MNIGRIIMQASFSFSYYPFVCCTPISSVNYSVMLPWTGPRKLFSKEEKVMLNKRVPDLASAHSVRLVLTILF